MLASNGLTKRSGVVTAFADAAWSASSLYTAVPVNNSTALLKWNGSTFAAETTPPVLAGDASPAVESAGRSPSVPSLCTIPRHVSIS